MSHRDNRLRAQKKLGAAIRAARKSRGISQADLARALAVQRSQVHRWESGAACPSALTLRSIAAAIGCTTDELLS